MSDFDTIRTGRENFTICSHTNRCVDCGGLLGTSGCLNPHCAPHYASIITLNTDGRAGSCPHCGGTGRRHR